MVRTHLHKWEFHENSQMPCTKSLVQNHTCLKQELLALHTVFYNSFSIKINNVWIQISTWEKKKKKKKTQQKPDIYLNSHSSTRLSRGMIWVRKERLSFSWNVVEWTYLMRTQARVSLMQKINRWGLMKHPDFVNPANKTSFA